ncbi:hypothetical protein HG535_0G03750 [Zygotorulaspora mrakii]|uniref:RWD domain-containing protein n=1 Tax=Zygotorulaspora mrakii TaxID=42260 RepID=A0A7H9B9U1_ZYGMR|nr:uncharacterized protein HG535_0G03750 [Zygotorulaspora mrakii]QLG74492.1 hypothetical protein HG535_0G03750 [Zygotorulaspora mrakii]
MDYKTEQAEELEVLESIYPDTEDLEILEKKYPDIRFTSKCELEPQVEDFKFTERLLLIVEFLLPEKYPDEAPIMKFHLEEEPLEDADGESDEEREEEEQEYDEHGNKVERKLKNFADAVSFEHFIPELQARIEEQIEEEMLQGTQMCFALISSIKELSESWYTGEINKLKREHELELQKREREEQKKFQGTKVTRESYLEWRSKFREEWKLDEKDEQRRTQAHHGRLTGKQIFQRGLAGEFDEEESEVNTTAEKLKKSVI